MNEIELNSIYKEKMKVKLKDVVKSRKRWSH
jgi:hypothetical protein